MNIIIMLHINEVLEHSKHSSFVSNMSTSSYLLAFLITRIMFALALSWNDSSKKGALMTNLGNFCMNQSPLLSARLYPTGRERIKHAIRMKKESSLTIPFFKSPANAAA